MKTKKYFVYLIVLLCIFSCDRFAQSSAPAQYDIFIEGEKDAKVTIQYSNWDSDNHVNSIKTEEISTPYFGDGVASVVYAINDSYEPSLEITNTTNKEIKVVFSSGTSLLVNNGDTLSIHNVMMWNYHNEFMQNQNISQASKISIDSLYIVLENEKFPGFKVLQPDEKCNLILQNKYRYSIIENF